MVVALWPLGAARAADNPFPRLPQGYRVAARETVAEGLERLMLVRERPGQVVHIARVAAGAPLALRVVVSNDAIAGPPPTMERTSSMCVRVRCLVAVNGDFGFLDSGQPVGGVVALGELARSPSDQHHQLLVPPEGAPAAGRLDWSGTFLTTDLRELRLDGVNVPREADRLVLYTPAWGPSTQTNAAGAELPLEVLRPDPPLRLGSTALVRMGELRYGAGDTPIPPRGAVLSGHGAGAEALRSVAERLQAGRVGEHALLRLESSPEVMDSVGGTPILLRGGKRWFADAPTSFVRGRHPRTIVGWDPSGTVLLVVVDGRRPPEAEGMTIAEAADLMLALGATEAINLDGGGSSTFVVRGQVVNRPSDRLVRRRGAEVVTHTLQPGDVELGFVERPVSVALVVVPRTAGPLPAPDPLAAPGISLPQAAALPALRQADPASVPGGTLPAVVHRPEPRPGPPWALVAAVVLFLAAASSRSQGAQPRIERAIASVLARGSRARALELVGGLRATAMRLVGGLRPGPLLDGVRHRLGRG